MLKTPVSILQELLQKKNKIPQYNLLPSEGIGTHNPTFSFIVTADQVTGYGKARSKKDAKHEAAKDALAKFTELGLYIPDQSSTPPVQSSPIKQEPDTPNFQINAVGMLKDFVAENNLPPPEFTEISDVGPAHQRLFTLQCTVGTLKKTATEYTKKKAKQTCAQLMYHFLLESLPDIADDSDIFDFLSIDDDKPNMEEIVKEFSDNSVSFNKKKENYKLKVAQYPQTLNQIMKEKQLSYSDLWEGINEINEENLSIILNRLDLKYTIELFDNEINLIVVLIIETEPCFSIAKIAGTKDAAIQPLMQETFDFLKILTR